VEVSIDNIHNLIKKPHAQAALSSAEVSSDKHKLHILGEGYESWLKDSKITSLESDRTTAIKEKICRVTTPRIFKGIINQQYKIFRADGFVRNYGLQSDTKKTELKEALDTIADGKSLESYMKQVWFPSLGYDFMGVIMVEIEPLTKEQIESEGTEIGKPVLAHYSIESIHDIGIVNGDINYIILSWTETHKVNDEEKKFKIYRYVDSQHDNLYYIDNDKLKLYDLDEDINAEMPNPFGKVPAIQISTRKKGLSSIEKTSWIEEAMKPADLYLSLSDDHTASVKLHQHPIFVSYPIKCHVCDGEGEVENAAGERISCTNTDCKEGYLKSAKADVAQGIVVPYNKSAIGDNITTPDVPAPVGYVTPDLATLEDQRTELSREEANIEKSALGVEGLLEKTATQETATGKELDMQALLDQLNMMSWNGETVEKFITDCVGGLLFGDSYTGSVIHWGRKYFIKSEAHVLKEYKEAKEAGANDSYLMELLTELTYTRFDTNETARDRALILLAIEPYPTKTIQEVKNLEMGNPDKLQFKLNMNDIVETFELKHGSLTEFKKGRAEQVDEIKKAMIVIFEEMKSARGEQGVMETLTAMSPLLANDIIARIPDEALFKALNIEVKPKQIDNEQSGTSNEN
jgi:hypothetical protein